MKSSFSGRLLVISFLIILSVPVCALNIAGGHTGNITALLHKGDTVISAGEDGYIVIWDIAQRSVSVRLQLTIYKIKSMILHPSKDEICIVETDNFDNNTISVWNYKQNKKLFSLHSPEPVTFINYSANGSFIIACGYNGRELALLNSGTGRISKTPDVPHGTISFAATGRNERNIFIYQGEHENDAYFGQHSNNYSEDWGQILYLDLNSGSVLNRFTTQGFLANPVIFGNNNFLAGINSNGLLLIDAASGAVLDIMENIDRNALLCPFDNELYCLNGKGGGEILYRFAVNGEGKFVTRTETPLSFETDIISSFVFNKSFIFASLQGNLFLLETRNEIIQLEYNSQTRITEIAAGKNSIAVLTENSDFFILPLDYRQMANNKNVQLIKKEGYTRITSVISAQDDQFILWQSANTRYIPQLINADRITNAENINSFTGRFPLRAISYMDDKITVLDNAGNLSVRGIENIFKQADFSSVFAGAVDTAVINNENLIISRIALNNNSPFLYVNYKTGETVHIPYPAQTGLIVFRGNSKIYAEVIEQNRAGSASSAAIITTVIDLTSALVKNSVPVKIFEYDGEISNLSIAESKNNIAINTNDGALIFSNRKIEFERTSGLPVKLLGCDDFFLSLDNDGNIAWHDNSSGKVLAVFSLYHEPTAEFSAYKWKLINKTETSGGFFEQ